MKKLVLIVFILSCFSYSFGQEKLVNEEGWELPKTGEVEKEREIVIEDIKVTENTLNVESKPIITLRESDSCEIRRAISYQVKNRIFAYKFSCVPFTDIGFRIKNYTFSRKSYAGAMFHFYYLDEDGDDLFEIRYSSLKTIETLPNWVKELK